MQILISDGFILADVLKLLFKMLEIFNFETRDSEIGGSKQRKWTITKMDGPAK